MWSTMLDLKTQVSQNPGPVRLHPAFDQPTHRGEGPLELERGVTSDNALVLTDGLDRPAVACPPDEARHALDRLIRERHGNRIKCVQPFFDDAGRNQPEAPDVASTDSA